MQLKFRKSVDGRKLIITSHFCNCPHVVRMIFNNSHSFASCLLPFTQQVRFWCIRHFPLQQLGSLIGRSDSSQHGRRLGPPHCYSRRVAFSRATVCWIWPKSPELPPWDKHEPLFGSLWSQPRISLCDFVGSADNAHRSSSDREAKHSPFSHGNVLAENIPIRTCDSWNIQGWRKDSPNASLEVHSCHPGTQGTKGDCRHWTFCSHTFAILAPYLLYLFCN